MVIDRSAVFAIFLNEPKGKAIAAMVADVNAA